MEEARPKRMARIAWLSPLPPQRSGIANYCFWLLKALRPHLTIDLYYDGQEPTAELKEQFDVYPVSAFEQQREEYEEVIYHLGNNSVFHKEIYKLAWKFPGTIVLHDYNISAFMHYAFYRQADGHLYEQALSNGGGHSNAKNFQALIHPSDRNAAQFPMSHAVVNRSKKVIVHHRWVRDQFINQNHIEVIPLYAKLHYNPTAEEVETFKKKFLINDGHFVLSCLGFINSNKLPQLQIDVVKRLLEYGYPVRLLFAGETAPDVKRLESEVQASEYRGNITFTGYLNEIDYFSAIFASDIIINLRNPSMGEASATLMHALAAAKPTIISDSNQYKEFPDKVCWKVTHNENEAHLLYEYLTVLLSNKNVRAAISDNSADYVKGVLALNKVIPQWLRVISK
jgi:glycosyltransferase involved in cell wall biosynthesis